MPGRAVALVLAIATVFVAPHVLGVSPSSAAIPEGSVQFQDGAGNAKQSFTAGETAVFYIGDTDLSTMADSTATWTEISAQVAAGEWWSLATGAPRASAYALSQGSAYDTTTPANTPLRSVPTAAVNGVPTLVSDFNDLTGELTLLNDVNSSSTLRVDFAFDVVDSYSATRHRAGVTSNSDTDGEWVGVSEVASETDAGSSPTAGLFRGAVLLSGDVAALLSGDGAVWVRPGDNVTVAYYDSDGATVIDSHQVPMASPTPTPGAPTSTPVSTSTPPVSAADWRYMSVLAGLFAVAIAWRRRVSTASRPRRPQG